METMIISYLLGAASLSIAIKNDTKFGMVKSFWMGITLLVPMVIIVIHGIANFFVNLLISGLFHLGLALGGESMDSVVESITSKILSEHGDKIKGVRSKINPDDDQKLQ
jgi:hypothetical protein